MTNFIPSEPVLRAAVFLGVFLVMAGWEALSPWRRGAVGRARRWPTHLALALINRLATRLVAPLGAVGVATFAAERGWGLSRLVAAPDWLACVAAVILLDLAIYAQHRVLHAVPILWRLHRMHHADVVLDVTTAVRFHPVEILLSFAIKAVVIILLGASPLAVLIFEMLLNGVAMFNHANIALPGPFERLLRQVIVTPGMHRIHHSVDPVETNSNFGFNLAWWDRLFGTYRRAPAGGELGLEIGLAEFRASRDQRLDRLLAQPFSAGGARP